MGRPSQGWKLFRDEGRTVWSVSFSHEGKRYERGTGHEREDLAAKRAAEIYADVLSGNDSKRSKKKRRVDHRPIGPVGAEWLNSLEGVIAPSTIETYAAYVKHFVEFFATVEEVEGRFESYIRHRLSQVQAKSIPKERGAMVGLLAFAFNVDRKKIQLAEVPTKAVGKRHKRGERSRTPLSPQEAIKIVRSLPIERVCCVREEGRGLGRKGLYSFKAFVRARVVVAYETSLRPRTLDLISVPENFYLGSRHLKIHSEQDKARFGRTVPLSKRARRYLEWCLRKLGPHYVGPIFGKFRFRKSLKNAGKAVGLDPQRVRTLKAYDLRAARLTHLAESGNLPATQWIAGHKKISTTAIYAQGSLRAAEEMLFGK